MSFTDGDTPEVRDPFAPPDLVTWDRMPLPELKSYLDTYRWNRANHPNASVHPRAMVNEGLTAVRVGTQSFPATGATAVSFTNAGPTPDLDQAPPWGLAASRITIHGVTWDPALPSRIAVDRAGLYIVTYWSFATRTPTNGAFMEFHVSRNGALTGRRFGNSYMSPPYNAGGVDVVRSTVTDEYRLKAGEYLELVGQNVLGAALFDYNAGLNLLQRLSVRAVASA